MTESPQDLPACDPTDLAPYIDFLFNNFIFMGFVLGVFTCVFLSPLLSLIVGYLELKLDKIRQEKGI